MLRTHTALASWSAVLLLAVASSCTGQVTPPGTRGTGPGGTVDESGQGASTAIPRLSRREIEASIVEVFGIEGAATRILPEEPTLVIDPATTGEEEVFDTFIGSIGTYVPSEVFVQASATLAFEVARDVSADPAQVDALCGCTPSGPDDAASFDALIDRVGLRLYRRPVTSEERDRLRERALDLAGDGDFYLGARVILQSLLTSPGFLYRQEIGEDQGEGLHRLDDYELLAKLSLLFFGAPPDEALLARAADGPLDDAQVEEIVRSLAADPRTDAQIRRFHRMWLRYERLLVTDTDLRADMLAESDALLDHVIGDDEVPWSELFTSPRTFVTPALATHYGMAPPAEAGWVDYENPERAGLLSHGSFLSLSSTQGDGTLPSRRGAMISRRLLCIPILPPPPDVDVDDGVEIADGACKEEAYAAHRVAGSTCQGCHEGMDAIGFGFERFDGLGSYRTEERESSACTIEGRGRAAGAGFSGPREFAAVVTESGDLTRCGTQQLLRFALRRQLASADAPLARRMHDAFLDSGEDFRALLVELALDPTFRQRQEASE